MSVRPLYRRGELPKRLREGRLDLAVDFSAVADEDVISEPPSPEPLALIARRGHPRLRGRLTLKQFLAEEHAVHHERRPSDAEPDLYAALAGLGHRVVMKVASPPGLPIVASETDLLAVVTERMARFFEKPLKLQVLPTAFRAAPIPTFLIWRRARRRDPGHRWLRDGIRAIFYQAWRGIIRGLSPAARAGARQQQSLAPPCSPSPCACRSRCCPSRTT